MRDAPEAELAQPQACELNSRDARLELHSREHAYITGIQQQFAAKTALQKCTKRVSRALQSRQKLAFCSTCLRIAPTPPTNAVERESIHRLTEAAHSSTQLRLAAFNTTSVVDTCRSRTFESRPAGLRHVDFRLRCPSFCDHQPESCVARSIVFTATRRLTESTRVGRRHQGPGVAGKETESPRVAGQRKQASAA